MLKYFANPLWAIHTTRGVQDVLKSEMDPRSPQKAPWHLACCMQAEVRSGGTRSCHSMSNVCRLCTCFPAVMGHGFLLVWRSSWPSVSYKSCLFPCSCHVFGRKALCTGKPENVRTCQQYAQTPWARNRSEPFLTVPSTRDAPTIHVYNAAKLCFIVFWPLFQCARTGRERFWPIPDCSCYT